ncbi:hypothetical protein ASD07_29810 [Duganella sp. Root336D2]|nr:hypothetical protein ASD07_29810 [Duganella sp. Root336D2]
MSGSGTGNSLDTAGSAQSAGPARQGSLFGRVLNQARNSTLGDVNAAAGASVVGPEQLNGA